MKLRGVSSSSSLFEERGNKWVTEKDQRLYHVEAVVELTRPEGDNRREFAPKLIPIPDENPDMDQWTVAGFRSKADSLKKSGLVTAHRILKDATPHKARKALNTSRVNYLRVLNRKLNSLKGL